MEKLGSCIAILSDDKSQTEVLEDGPHIGEKRGNIRFYEFYEDIIDDFEIYVLLVVYLKV